MSDTQNGALTSYNPNRLLDEMHARLNVKNDAALSRKLGVQPPVISKVRHLRSPLSSALLIRMHELSGIPVRDMQSIMGDRRAKYRLSDAQGRPKAALAP